MTKTIKFAEDLPSLHQEKMEELKKLLPNLFDKDGNLLKSELENFASAYESEKSEPFVFSWAGKQKAKGLAFKQSEVKLSLKFDEKRSKDFDKTQNLIIEGDNLHVLKLLLPSYKGKVKCIYIDPPYNTQNDFIYPDNFAESEKEYLLNSGQIDSEGNLIINDRLETNGRKHSTWLSMIYPRLVLARELLREDGVIFVSIDDNEVHHLRQLMNEVFGEEEFVATFKWNQTSKAPTLSKSVRKKYEYVLSYSKNPKINLKGKKSYNTMAPLFNSSNNIQQIAFPTGSIDCLFDDGIYKKGIYGKDNKEVELLDDLIVENNVNASSCTISARFKWSQKTIDQYINEGRKLAFKKPNFTTMYYYLNNSTEDGQDKFIAPSDIINMEECEVERNDEGFVEVKNLFDGLSIFDYPCYAPQFSIEIIESIFSRIQFKFCFKFDWAFVV